MYLPGVIKITNSTIQKNFDFRNSLFSEIVRFDAATFCEYAGFNGATFCRNAVFEEATFGKTVSFDEAVFSTVVRFNAATFCEYAGFNGVTFSDTIEFIGVTFYEQAGFNGATFKWYAGFIGVTFSKHVEFSRATFSSKSGKADFNEVTFGKTVSFDEAVFSGDAKFSKATFDGEAWFNGAKFEGDVLTFRNATFTRAKSQEEACRRAKNLMEKNGNREEAGYHFYREMEGKRRQKSWYIRYPEFFFLQSIFGYGVHPFRLMYWWFLIVVVFSFIYSNGNGIDGIEHWYDYIKISFAISIAPGYISAIINPESAGYRLTPMYQAVAIIETIVGTFLWAGFIATFAKKYMR